MMIHRLLYLDKEPQQENNLQQIMRQNSSLQIITCTSAFQAKTYLDDKTIDGVVICYSDSLDSFDRLVKAIHSERLPFLFLTEQFDEALYQRLSLHSPLAILQKSTDLNAGIYKLLDVITERTQNKPRILQAVEELQKQRAG